MSPIYALTSENLTSPYGGGPTINYTNYFMSVDAAKTFAEADYFLSGRRPIEWTEANGKWCSGDLRFVMFWIKQIKIEALTRAFTFAPAPTPAGDTRTKANSCT